MIQPINRNNNKNILLNTDSRVLWSVFQILRSCILQLFICKNPRQEILSSNFGAGQNCHVARKIRRLCFCSGVGVYLRENIRQRATMLLLRQLSIQFLCLTNESVISKAEYVKHHDMISCQSYNYLNSLVL